MFDYYSLSCLAHIKEKQELICFRNRLKENLAALPSFVVAHPANVWYDVQVPATWKDAARMGKRKKKNKLYPSKQVKLLIGITAHFLSQRRQTDNAR